MALSLGVTAAVHGAAFWLTTTLWPATDSDADRAAPVVFAATTTLTVRSPSPDAGATVIHAGAFTLHAQPAAVAIVNASARLAHDPAMDALETANVHAEELSSTTCIENDELAVPPFPSVTVTVTAWSPISVVVPDIVPVEGSIAIPDGRPVALKVSASRFSSEALTSIDDGTPAVTA